MIGPAIDDVTSCLDQLDWIGISATNKLSEYIIANNLYQQTNDYLYDNAIPTKNNVNEGSVLNWLGFTDPNIINILKNEHLKQINPIVRKKYDNSINYYYRCVRNMQR
jgi:hypothetical protein